MSQELPASVDHTVRDWLDSHHYGAAQEWRQLGGGSQSMLYLVTTDTARTLVAKVSPLASADRWYMEAQGLRLIARSKAIRTPAVLHVDDQCLLLEHISSVQQTADYWTQLGNRLASLHRVTQTHNQFGLGENNYCGDNLQINKWNEDGHAFFAEQRLLHQARLAFDNGYLESPWIIHVESICERLPELIPHQPPSLLHGDLWPGNILVDNFGAPALIDPAVYYGWREADIAMSLLFGGLAHEFYLAYDEAWPMEKGWRSRVELYNLYHLLNHLNIFGVSYLEQVQNAIVRYA